MKRVKICPKCRGINDEYATYCANPECKASLLLLHVQAEELNSAAKALPAAEAKKVEKDQGQVPAIRPTERLDLEYARLEYAGPPVRVFQVRSGDIVGRGGEARVNVGALERSRYISRVHARFFVNQGIWYIEPLLQTNKTLVDGVEIPSGGRYPLREKATVTLANTEFVFRVGC